MFGKTDAVTMKLDGWKLVGIMKTDASINASAFCSTDEIMTQEGSIVLFWSL